MCCITSELAVARNSSVCRWCIRSLRVSFDLLRCYGATGDGSHPSREYRRGCERQPVGRATDHIALQHEVEAALMVPYDVAAAMAGPCLFHTIVSGFSGIAPTYSYTR